MPEHADQRVSPLEYQSILTIYKVCTLYPKGGKKMKSSTVNISFSDDLLGKIDQEAREESRSRSELIREAARGYIDRKHRWKRIVDFGKMNAAKKRIPEADVETEIAAFRREKKK